MEASNMNSEGVLLLCIGRFLQRLCPKAPSSLQVAFSKLKKKKSNAHRAGRRDKKIAKCFEVADPSAFEVNMKGGKWYRSIWGFNDFENFLSDLEGVQEKKK